MENQAYYPSFSPTAAPWKRAPTDYLHNQFLSNQLQTLAALKAHIDEAQVLISDQKLNICISYTKSSKSRFFAPTPPLSQWNQLQIKNGQRQSIQRPQKPLERTIHTLLQAPDCLGQKSSKQKTQIRISLFLHEFCSVWKALATTVCTHTQVYPAESTLQSDQY